MIRIRTFKESPANQRYRNHIADVHKELGEFIFKEFPELISINKNEEYTDYFVNIPTRIYLPYMLFGFIMLQFLIFAKKKR